jgi:hypothetical protein
MYKRLSHAVLIMLIFFLLHLRFYETEGVDWTQTVLIVLDPIRHLYFYILYTCIAISIVVLNAIRYKNVRVVNIAFSLFHLAFMVPVIVFSIFDMNLNYIHVFFSSYLALCLCIALLTLQIVEKK